MNGDSECSKCHSRDIFKIPNKGKGHDKGLCRRCKHVANYDEFLLEGSVSLSWGKEFDKDNYYERKAV